MRLPPELWTPAEKGTFALLRGLSPRRCWVTGGWVRDALLEHGGVSPRAAGEWRRLRRLAGHPRGDVDVLVDGRSAQELHAACLRSEPLRAVLHGPPLLVPPRGARAVATLKLRLPGHSLDVTSLRDSPQQLGTPAAASDADVLQLDAAHRDTTFNACYYDLNSEEVLDPTGHGVADLRAGVVRMPHPLGAVASIQEDPVRLLRTYRFASRYGFELDDSIHDAEDANRLFKATPPGRVLFEVKKSLLLHNRPSQFLAHLAGPSEVHRHLFEAAGAATLDPWQACVGKVGRLEALVLDGVGRGILTARSVQWRGRRPDSTQAGLLAPDWRKSGVWEADWVELLLGALLWRCSRDAVQKVGAALQLSHRMVENVLVLQGQARQKQISKQTAPPGVHLLRCAVASGETFDEFWDRWPKENAGHDASARG